MGIFILNSTNLLNCIRTILPDPEKFYPLHEPKFDCNAAEQVKQCVESGWVSSSGENINKLEETCKEMLQIKYCVAVSSGTAALHLAYIAAGIDQGSEVFCPGVSFVATANAIKYVGAEPSFIDIDRATLCMCADSLAFEIEQNCIFQSNELINKKNQKKISAIVTVNAFGNSPDLVKIKKIADNYNLNLIEDAAGAFGSKYQENTPGFLSDIATYSFNGNKILTGGAGGLVVTQKETLAEKIKHLSTTAKLAHPWDYHHDVVGFNYRMPNLNATLLLTQLKSFDEILFKA